MNQSPEALNVEKLNEKEKQNTVFDAFDQMLLAESEEAEKRVASNPNVTAFVGWENETVSAAKLEAMINKAHSTFSELLSEVPDFDDNKIRQVAEAYVNKMLARKREPSEDALAFK